MSSLQSASQPDSTSVVSDVLTPPAETVRSCADRERRLTEYIRAHTGEDIAVWLTPRVPTACVTPTSEEALVESDNAEFSNEQARKLAESIDADYLVLIGTHPANVENLPISDQLTADRAQQFGYALHELGHIRYTAIADAASLLEERVDEDWQEFVHGLWNGCEDAAIENQLALDQSQLAADRLELMRRSMSTHADDFPANERREFTFRDAVDTALYDEGIYDTGVRDALCDPGNDRIVFASDADRQAFEQVADSIAELVATVLSTPNSVERIEHILDWWETVVKPLLDPSEQNQQESGQPDPAGTSGESSTSADSSTSSSSSSEERGTDQSTSEGTDADRSPTEEEKQDEGATGDRTSETESFDSAGRDERDTDEAPNEVGEVGEMDGSDGTDETAGSQSEQRPDPDAINTDQRQSSPGADALDYPDIGENKDADALDQPESDDRAKSGPDDADTESAGDNEGEEQETTESQSPVEPSDDTQTAESGRRTESSLDAADDASAETTTETTASDAESGDEDTDGETAGAVGGSDNDTDRDDEGQTNGVTENGTDAGGREETAESSDEQSTPEHGSDASHGDTTSAADEGSEQGGESESESATSESQSSENPWGTPNSDGTNQTSLGSFSTPDSQTESESGVSDGGKSNTEDTTLDTDTRNRSSNSGETTESGSGDENTGGKEPIESSDGGSSIGDESKNREERAEADIRIADEGDSNTVNSDEAEKHADTPSENVSELDEPDESPSAPSPAHADDEEGLDREGALSTDHDAAHDEAERATPDEKALEREFEDIAAALDALDEKDSGGATPGSLSELAIMPDAGGSTTFDTAERWGEAAADAEFVADALRKALKESRRDAHRSGVTSGTFDRQRAGALARGDVSAFHVRQPGDDKQYDLVMILDRSGSMRKHIETAENALVRFALACEDIGINVGVIDFYDDDARLIKPFSVECEHVRESFLSSQYEGNTPLADALGLGRELLEQRRNSPLVLVVTDGKPGDEDAYHDEIAQSYAPVCGLTLVLDKPSGCVPERVARNEQFYDRHVYVHEPSQLANRLDQFAVMFDGL